MDVASIARSRGAERVLRALKNHQPVSVSDCGAHRKFPGAVENRNYIFLQRRNPISPMPRHLVRLLQPLRNDGRCGFRGPARRDRKVGRALCLNNEQRSKNLAFVAKIIHETPSTYRGIDLSFRNHVRNLSGCRWRNHPPKRLQHAIDDVRADMSFEGFLQIGTSALWVSENRTDLRHLRLVESIVVRLDSSVRDSEIIGGPYSTVAHRKISSSR